MIYETPNGYHCYGIKGQWSEAALVANIKAVNIKCQSTAEKYHYGCEIVTKNIRNDDNSEYSTMTSCQTLLDLPVRTQMTYLIYNTYARLPSA